MYGSVLNIVVCLMLIYYKVGDAIVYVVISLLGLLLINVAIVFVMEYNFEKMASHKDNRISLTTDVYTGIKSIKYLSWEKIFN